MSFYVPNKRIACTPLGEMRNIQMQGTGFKTVVQKGSLLKLTVVHGNESYNTGDFVWIRGDAMTTPWSREEFTGPNGEVFILVPEDYIQLRQINV